jgi:hypothetical protein
MAEDQPGTKGKSRKGKKKKATRCPSKGKKPLVLAHVEANLEKKVMRWHQPKEQGH